MKELNNGDVRWFFDEYLEKAVEVKIKCKTTEEWARSSCYWCIILETGKESIFEDSFLYKSKEEAIKEFTKELEEDIKEREKDLKEYVNKKTESIKRQKALLEKIKKECANQ